MISPKSQRVVAWGVVIAAVLTFVLWTRHFPTKARALTPVITELETIYKTTGQFTTNVQALTSVKNIERTYRVYFGERPNTNLFWAAADVSSHDLTILVGTNYFLLFAPTGKMKLWSGSSFPAWRRIHEDSEWQRGRIHWSLLGTYWSKD